MLFPGAFVRLEGGVSSSLLFEIGVGDELALDAFLSDCNHANAATRRCVSVAGECDGVLDKVSGLVSSKVRTV